jgi:hypothetical protein
MLMNYSKIIHAIQALKTGRIVGWEVERKGRCYVKEVSVDWPVNYE